MGERRAPKSPEPRAQSPEPRAQSPELATLDLPRRALTALERAGHGAGLIAARGLAGEEQGRFDRASEGAVRCSSTDRGVRIRAAAEGISLPVMGPACCGGRVERAPAHPENLGEGIESASGRRLLPLRTRRVRSVSA